MLLGIILDGTPESMVIGLGILEGGSVSLAMPANSMMPEAFEHGGKLAGLFTVVGFSASVLVVILEHAG